MTSAIKDECISAYKGAGFQLFPCIILDGKKRPAVRNWQAMDTPAILPDVFGVNLTHEVAVLDYDWRRDPDYDTATSDFSGTQLSKLWKALNLPGANTYIVESTNGYHVYFLKPDDVYLRNRVPGYDAIDIKTGGGFVVGAGSVNPETGFTYKPIRGSADELAEIPVQLLDLIRFDRDAILIDQREIETDDADTQRVFRDYCRTGAPTAIEGSGGDNATYQVACVGRDYGLPENVVLDIMEAFYNTPEKCCPTWDYGELAAKVANAFSYAQNKQGYRSPEARFENVRDTIDVKTRDAAVAEESKPKYTMEYGLKWSFDVDKATGDKIFKPHTCNVISFLQLDTPSVPNPLLGLFRFNDFAKEIEFSRPAPWHRQDWQPKYFTDNDALLLMQYLMHKNLHIGKDKIIEGVFIVAQENAYHPIRDYLRGLKWDGTPRIDTFHSAYMGAADNLYTREVSRILFIGAVARALHPGCQFDYMIVWEGEQGTFKSSAVKALGEAPGDFYGDIVIDPKNKETVQNLQGLWIVEVSEMASYKKAEVDQFKRFVTLKSDRIMKKYDRMTSDMPRCSVMLGTINPGTGGYLADEQNRRFLPIVTGKIEIDSIIEDRDQLFAEAYVRYTKGEKPFIQNSTVKVMAEQEQAARMVDEEWTELIADWIATQQKLLEKPLTTANVALFALNIPKEHLNRLAAIRIAKAMKLLGYHQPDTSNARITQQGKRIRLWIPKETCTVDYI